MDSWFDRWFAPTPAMQQYLRVRWLFLRGLGLIFFSAFYSLAFQIHGLIGPDGILPARDYLPAIAKQYGVIRYWLAPTLLWFSQSRGAMTAIVVVGIIASVALVLNLWPRLAILVALLSFLSFIAAAQDFASYQSDGMLLEAAAISILFAPSGLRPGLGAANPPTRASLFLLQWEWFRIYFESGVVKIASGEEQWRNFTAMDKYYENGPLPTWIGWYTQHLPHSFHAATVAFTLVTELLLVWLLFFPRRWRIVCFFIVTALQAGIILSANYAFLNYLVLLLGVLLLDDRFLESIRGRAIELPDIALKPRWRVSTAAVFLIWMFYASIAMFLASMLPAPLVAPAVMLEPFRFANAYGLFAVMTRARYEIEFQGTTDGRTWIIYPFRYKPQDVKKAPAIYAPYQPRFEWNLWFASLGEWQEYPWVLRTEMKLLEGSPDVLKLFASDPLHGTKPVAVRAVRWQYWFSSPEEKRASGVWWDRKFLGAYAPELERKMTQAISVTK